MKMIRKRILKVCFTLIIILLFGKTVFASDIITDIQAPHGVSVFECGENVALMLNHEQMKANIIIRWELTDVFGEIRFSNAVKLYSGSVQTKVEFGVLPIGWYRVRFYKGETEACEKYCSISVVQPLSSRNSRISSPVAVDQAGQYASLDGSFPTVAWTESEREAYAYALKCAGVGYVRERVGDFNFDNGYYDVIEEQTEILADAGLPVLNTNFNRKDDNSDLYSVYLKAKGNAEYYDGKIMAWEGANEPDIDLMPDRAASLMKAASVGVIDSGANAIKVASGVYNIHTADFFETYVQNGILDYTDCLNVHSHRGYDTDPYLPLYTDILHQARELATVYGGGCPIWVTESGIQCRFMDENGDTLDECQPGLARYAVTSAVESLAEAGTARHFYFLARHYTEKGNWGLFSTNHMPYAGYSSLASLTYYLGEGRLQGDLRGLPDNVKGYMFDSGENSVAILWNQENGTKWVQFNTDCNVRVVDIMGSFEDKLFSPVNEMINIPVTEYPVLVVFPSMSSEDNYYKREYPDYPEVSVNELTDAQRIIIRQTWMNAETKEARYQLEEGIDYDIMVEACNLSDKTAVGFLEVQVSDALEVVGDKTALYRIKANSTGQYYFTVRIKPGFERDEAESFVSFGGSYGADGEELSASVAKCIAYVDKPVYLDTVVKDFDKKSSWNWINLSNAKATLKETSGGIRLDIKADAEMDDVWTYPWYTVDEKQFADSDGIYFTLNVPEGCGADNVIGRVFVKTKTDEIGFLAPYGTFVEGDTTYRISWDDFNGRLSLVKAHFNPEEITEISIGFNATYVGKATGYAYVIKDFGTYTYSVPQIMYPEIKISGIDEKAIYKSNQILSVEAVIPDGLKNVCAYINYEEWNDFSIKDGKVSFNLERPEPGAYNVMITAENCCGYVCRTDVNFYVRQREDYNAKGTFYN